MNKNIYKLVWLASGIYKLQKKQEVHLVSGRSFSISGSLLASAGSDNNASCDDVKSHFSSASLVAAVAAAAAARNSASAANIHALLTIEHVQFVWMKDKETGIEYGSKCFVPLADLSLQ